MNNSENTIPYQRCEGGRGDLCFEENYRSALFFQALGVNRAVHRSREFWPLSRENLNI